MENLILYFSKNPIIGFISSILTTVFASINTIEIYVKFVGIVLGLIVAGLTAYAKILDIIIKRKQLKNEKAKNKIIRIDYD
ncbi:MAG TPA: hypothetical protein DCS17_02940 [Flavobacterium sp.]|nr:hypothetical protein [Flavobacterium sp.]